MSQRTVINTPKTIVIVDDDRDTIETIEMALTMDGYTVRSAEDPAEALDVIAAEKPEMVLLDYYGVSADNHDLVRRIKLAHPGARIVLMTGAVGPAEKAKRLGLREWLAKPFEAEQLRNLLGSRRRRNAKPTEALAFSLF